MPANPIGVTFAPTFENSQLASRGEAASRPQGPIQTLSYRLPRVRGAQGLSPLMGDEPKGGPNMAVLESVFRTLFGPEEVAAFLGSRGELSSAASDLLSSTGGQSGPRRRRSEDPVILAGLELPGDDPQYPGGSGGSAGDLVIRTRAGQTPPFNDAPSALLERMRSKYDNPDSYQSPVLV